MKQVTKVPKIKYDALILGSKEDSGWAKTLMIRLRKAGARITRGKWASSDLEKFSTFQSQTHSEYRKIILLCGPSFRTQSALIDQVRRYLQSNELRLKNERPIIPVLRGFQPPPEWDKLLPIDFNRDEDFDFRLHQLLEALEFGEVGGTMARLIRWLGLERVKKDAGFTEGVGKAFELLRFRVSSGAGHRKNDPLMLTIEKREAGVPVNSYVYCFDGLLNPSELDRILSILSPINGKRWMIVTSNAIPVEVSEKLTHLGIGIQTYYDILHEVLPLETYAKQLIEECSDSKKKYWDGKDWFVRPDGRLDKRYNRLPAMSVIAEWLGRKDQKHLVILGDIGIGKTTLANFLAEELARAFVQDPLRHPAPILIKLLHARKRVDLSSVITEHFNRRGISFTDYKHFEHLINTGRIVLIFDAFDEMADRLRKGEIKYNLEQILAPASSGGKILLTCRTQYFKSHSEQMEQLGFNAESMYLTDFEEPQIRTYLSKSRAGKDRQDWDVIERTYNLPDLIKRPLFMDWCVRSIDKLTEKNSLDSASFYSKYVRMWAKREKKKERLIPPKSKIGFMMELAWQAWENDIEKFPCEDISAIASRLLEERRYEFAGETPEEIASEMRTASFLKREDDEVYDFVDFSLREYFLARLLYQSLKRSHLCPPITFLLDTHLFTNRVILFLTYLDRHDRMLEPLQQILRETYRPRISENALQILYWSGRFRSGMGETIHDSAILHRIFAERIPRGAILTGAQFGPAASFASIALDHADFSNADLSGVDFSQARLIYTSFRNADLSSTTIEQVYADSTDFHEVLLNGAFIQDSELRSCDFTGAIHHGLIFDRNTHPGTKGLSGVVGPQKHDLRPVVQRAHSGPVSTVAISRDSKIGASGGYDGLIVLFRINDGRLLRIIDAHIGRTNSIHFSANGSRLLSGGDDGRIRLWSVWEDRLISEFKGHAGPVRAVRFSPDGEHFASGGDDKTLRYWSIEQGSCIRTFSEHQGAVNSIHFYMNGGKICSGSDDCTVRVWNVGNGHLESVMPGDDHGRVNCVRYSPNGNLIAVGCDDQDVRLLRTSDGQLEQVSLCHPGMVRSLEFSPDNRLLVTSGSDHTARVWSVPDGKMLRTLNGHNDVVESVRFSQDNKLIISGGYDKNVRIWRAKDGKCLCEITGSNGAIRSISQAIGGNIQACGGDDFKVYLWRNGPHPENSVLQGGHTGRISSIALGSDGSRLVSASRDQTICIWDVAKGSLLYRLENKGPINSVRLSPDGQWLISAGADHGIRLWSALSGQLLHVIGGAEVRGIASFFPTGHDGPVNTIRFSPTGDVFVSAGEDRAIRFWNLEKRKSLFSINSEHSDGVTTIEFSPNGRLLASGSRDGKIHLWDYATRKRLRIFSGHHRKINSVRFTPDGEMLATASADGSVCLWSVEKGELIRRLGGHLGPVHSILFSDRGKYLYTAGAAGRIQIWDMDKTEPILFRYRFSSDAWLDLLPDGRFDASLDGRRFLHYTAQGGISSHPADQLSRDFYAPEAVRAIVMKLQRG